MANYLEKFNDLIRKRQAEQVLKLLNTQKQTGKIRTIEEFTSRLDTLIRELTQSTLTPTLKLFEAEVGQSIDSESHNYHLDRVQDDLQAAFEESINISEVQESHQAIVRDVLLKNLRSGVAELESKVALYQFLNSNQNGFDAAVFSTFRESREERTSRNEENSSLFISPRTTLETFSLDEDSVIDVVGERLTSGLDEVEQIRIRNVTQLFDSEAPQSQIIVEPPSSKLSNLIDGQSGTYWLQAVLFEENKTSVKTKLQLDLGGVKTLNFIEIEPATRFGLILESIYFLDSNNAFVKVADPELTINSPTSVQLRSISTKKLVLVFRNENFTRIEFDYWDRGSLLTHLAQNESPLGTASDMQAVSEAIAEIVSSAGTLEAIGCRPAGSANAPADTPGPGERAAPAPPAPVGGPTPTPPPAPSSSPDTRSPNPPILGEQAPTIPPSDRRSRFEGWQSEVGFDNIRVGKATYKTRGIYISKPLELAGGVGVLGLKTVESRPSAPSITANPEMVDDTYNTDDGIFFHSSLEYWCIRHDFDEDNNLLSVSRFPILPIGVERIHHERLLLEEKSDPGLALPDVGYTNFFTDRVLGDVKVYRNGILLASADAVPNTSDGWEDVTELTDQIPDDGDRMKMKVKIQQPLPGDIFTVTYDRLVSNTSIVPKTLAAFTAAGLSVVDLVGDLSARIVKDNLIVVDNITNADRISKSVIYLAVIHRNNTADTNLTASLEEYMFVSGSKDTAKFLGIQNDS